jgi:exopolyphosphatase/guanosine-5'-triphosphate,3'-diphosphate pyrophosphatase
VHAVGPGRVVADNAEPADPETTMSAVKVGVIDVGSNSVRLLVAAVDSKDTVKQLLRERAYLRLGDDAHRLGRISDAKLAATKSVARDYARLARKRGVERLTTIVTAPGRQASNPDDLLDVLTSATDAPVVLLNAEHEGRLAWEGAVSRMKDTPSCIAVLDLGGGSFELAVGTPDAGPSWVESRDAGALRVTRSFLPGAHPSAAELARAREQVRELLEGLEPPRPDVTLAVGGTARALGRLLGRRYGVSRLEELVTRLVAEGPARVTRGTEITPERAETLLGGTLVLAEIAGRLKTKLEVGRGGLREGAALALARAEAVAA